MNNDGDDILLFIRQERNQAKWSRMKREAWKEFTLIRADRSSLLLGDSAKALFVHKDILIKCPRIIMDI